MNFKDTEILYPKSRMNNKVNNYLNKSMTVEFLIHRIKFFTPTIELYYLRNYQLYVIGAAINRLDIATSVKK